MLHLKKHTLIGSIIPLLFIILAASFVPISASFADTYRSFYEQYSPTWANHKSQELLYASSETLLSELDQYVYYAPPSLNLIQTSDPSVLAALQFIEKETGLSSSNLVDLSFCIVKSPLQSETIDLLIGYNSPITDSKVKENTLTRYESIGIPYASNYGEWIIRIDPDTYMIVETCHMYRKSIIKHSSEWHLFGDSKLDSTHTEYFLALVNDLRLIGQLEKENRISQSDAFSRQNQIMLAFGASPSIYDPDSDKGFDLYTDLYNEIYSPSIIEVAAANPTKNKHIYFSPDHLHCSIYCIDQNNNITDYYFLSLEDEFSSHVAYPAQIDDRD